MATVLGTCFASGAGGNLAGAGGGVAVGMTLFATGVTGTAVPPDGASSESEMVTTLGGGRFGFGGAATLAVLAAMAARVLLGLATSGAGGGPEGAGVVPLAPCALEPCAERMVSQRR